MEPFYWLNKRGGTMEAFKQFAEDMGLGIKATPAPQSKGQEGWGEIPPVTFDVSLTDRWGEVIFQGNYSQGIGYAEAWTRSNEVEATKGLSPALRRYVMNYLHVRGSVRGDEREAVLEALRGAYARHISENPETILLDVLYSLQVDVTGCDQLFEAWADDFGYCTDSIKARDIWETCNKTRRHLMAAFGDRYDDFTTLEEF